MAEKIPVLYVEEEGGVVEVTLPTKWEICVECRGNGMSSSYLGAFTSSEWAEEDEEFKEDYMAGKYDKSCEYCDGSGKVRVVDWERLDEKTTAAYIAQLEEEAQDRATERAERAMGA